MMETFETVCDCGCETALHVVDLEDGHIDIVGFRGPDLTAVALATVERERLTEWLIELADNLDKDE